VLFDWADSFAGNPLLDLNRVIDGATADDRAVRDHWLDRWRRAVPGSDPRRAADLLAPVLPLRDAWVYQRFVDRGGSAKDFSAIIKMIDDSWKVPGEA